MKKRIEYLIAAGLISLGVVGFYLGLVSPGNGANIPYSQGQYNTVPPTLSNGQFAVMQMDANGNVKIVGSISCTSGCSASSNPDEGTFSPGVTSFALTGGFYETIPTANPLTNGQGGAFQVTAQRALFSNLRNSSGTEIGTAANPVNVSAAGSATAIKVSGTANSTGTGSTSLVSLVISNRLYIMSFSCANTGNNTTLISFQDGSGGTTLWTTVAPAGGGSNGNGGNAPMFWTTSGNGLYFAAGTGSTTVYCSASGFYGS